MDALNSSRLDLPRGALRSTYAADPDMQELIRTFVSRLPKRVEHMMDLIRAQDLAQLRHVVHQLKGAGGGYGFAEITHQAADVEKIIKAGATLEHVTEQVNLLVGLLQRVDGYSEEESSAASS